MLKVMVSKGDRVLMLYSSAWSIILSRFLLLEILTAAQVIVVFDHSGIIIGLSASGAPQKQITLMQCNAMQQGTSMAGLVS